MTHSEVTPMQPPYATETGRKSPCAPVLERELARGDYFPWKSIPSTQASHPSWKTAQPGRTVGTSR